MFSSNIGNGKMFSTWHWRILAAAVLVVILLGPFTPRSRAEQLDTKVELFLELLPFQKQEKLENLGEELDEYFCNFEWIEDFTGPPVPLTFRMYLVDESTGFEDRYGARIHASNGYDIQHLDKECHFAYQPEETLEHDAIIYHPLTGLLDFYAYLIIGGEMDKRATLGGDPYFKKARDTVQEGLFSEYYKGWNRRSEELEALLTEENVTYRKMLAVYFRSLLYWNEGIVEEARIYCRSALAMIEEILQQETEDEEITFDQQEQIARFFTHHHLKIADIFAEDPQGQAVFELLLTLDPQHSEVYERYLEN